MIYIYIYIYIYLYIYELYCLAPLDVPMAKYLMNKIRNEV